MEAKTSTIKKEKNIMKKVLKKILNKNEAAIFWRRYFYVKNHKNLLKYIYLISLKKIERKYNCGIPISANLKNNIVLPHGLNGIFISQGATIGDNCVIFHQVTIGSNTLKDSKKQGSPIIGNNVYIGAGAKIIGKVTVGNNVRIGANCVVVKDIPDNTTVVLGDNRMIHHETIKDNQFYQFEKEN